MFSDRSIAINGAKNLHRAENAGSQDHQSQPCHEAEHCPTLRPNVLTCLSRRISIPSRLGTHFHVMLASFLRPMLTPRRVLGAYGQGLSNTRRGVGAARLPSRNISHPPHFGDKSHIGSRHLPTVRSISRQRKPTDLLRSVQDLPVSAMGSSKASALPHQPGVYRDDPDRDDAASMSSAVLLGDIDDIPDEDLPSYADSQPYADESPSTSTPGAPAEGEYVRSRPGQPAFNPYVITTSSRTAISDQLRAVFLPSSLSQTTTWTVLRYAHSSQITARRPRPYTPCSSNRLPSRRVTSSN